MKKIIAIMLCVAAIFCLAVPAMAEESPSGQEMIKVTVVTIPGEPGVTTVYEKGETVIAEFNPNSGTFNKWRFYLPDGSVAVPDKDFIIVEGTIETGKIVVQSNVGHLYIVANYDGKVTDPFTGVATKPVSPTTGNAMVAYAALVMLAGAAVVFSAKKACC